MKEAPLEDRSPRLLYACLSVALVSRCVVFLAKQHSKQAVFWSNIEAGALPEYTKEYLKIVGTRKQVLKNDVGDILVGIQRPKAQSGLTCICSAHGLSTPTNLAWGMRR
jgi:hypothetical protein